MQASFDVLQLRSFIFIGCHIKEASLHFDHLDLYLQEKGIQSIKDSCCFYHAYLEGCVFAVFDVSKLRHFNSAKYVESIFIPFMEYLESRKPYKDSLMFSSYPSFSNAIPRRVLDFYVRTVRERLSIGQCL